MRSVALRAPCVFCVDRCRSCARDQRRLPPGHARPAEVRPAARVHLLRRRAIRAAVRPGHRRTRAAARGRAPLHRQGERRGRHDVSVCGGRHGDGARPGAVQHLLLAVPRAHRPRRWDGRPPRLPSSAVVSRRPAAQRTGRAFLRRHQQRLRRDARLRGADPRGRPLGDRRLHPCAAAQRPRDARRRAGRSAREDASNGAQTNRGRAHSRTGRLSAAAADSPAAPGWRCRPSGGSSTRRSSTSRI